MPQKKIECKVKYYFCMASSWALCIEKSLNNLNNTDSIHVLCMKSAKEENKLLRQAVSLTLPLFLPCYCPNESNTNASRCPLVFYQYSQKLLSICCQSSRTVHIQASESMQSGKLTSFQQHHNFHLTQVKWNFPTENLQKAFLNQVQGFHLKE